MPSVVDIEQFLTSIYQDQSGEPAKLAHQISTTILHPVLASAALRYVLGLPVVSVDMSKEERRHARWLYNPWRPWKAGGYVSSCLELPSPIETYSKGSSRQELRRRTSQAHHAGFRARVVEPSDVLDVISLVFKARGEEHDIEGDLRKLNVRDVNDPLDGSVCVGVFDQFDTPVAFSLGAKTGNVVTSLLSCTAERGAVRWLCFNAFVEEVSARGARFIVQSAPWSFSGGNRIFADHLGFAPARVRPRRDDKRN